MTMTYFECFNTKLDEFLKDLSTSFPEFNDVKVLRNGLKLAMTIDAKLPQKYFNENLTSSFETHIMSRDEKFFLEQDYQEIIRHNSNLINGIDLDIIPKIKSIWKTLDDSNKDAIWKYLQLLVLLNKKCNI